MAREAVALSDLLDVTSTLELQLESVLGMYEDTSKYLHG